MKAASVQQRTARRPLALEAFYLDLRRSGCRGSQPGLRLGFGSIRFQIGELKLELFEDGAALGGLAVLLVAQLGDGELHLLDQQRPRLRLGLRVLRLHLRGKARRIRGDQHRLQRSYMDGNLVLGLKSKAESELRSGMERFKPEEAAVLVLLRSCLAKEAEGSRRQRARAA
jgi:hypothetical protein